MLCIPLHFQMKPVVNNTIDSSESTSEDVEDTFAEKEGDPSEVDFSFLKTGT